MAVMEWSQTRKALLLALLAVGVIYALNAGFLSPEGLRAMGGALSGWWTAYQAWVWTGLGLGMVLAGGMVLLRWQRNAAQRRAVLERVASGPTILLLPRADWKAVDPEEAQVWARLADALPHEQHISFEVAGGENEIAFGLHGSEEGLRAAMTQYKAEWPGLHTRPAGTDPAQVPAGWHTWWVELAPGSYERAARASTRDPLRAVLIELNGVLGDGRGLVQVIARRNFGARKRLGQQAFAARDEETPSKGVRALRTQEAKELEARARATYLDVTVRAVGMADTQERAQGIARGLARAIAASFDSSNPVQPVNQGRSPEAVIRRQPGRMAVWSANDLAWLAHLVGSDLAQLAPRLQTAPARSLPAEAEMRFQPEKHRTAYLEEA